MRLGATFAPDAVLTATLSHPLTLTGVFPPLTVALDTSRMGPVGSLLVSDPPGYGDAAARGYPGYYLSPDDVASPVIFQVGLDLSSLGSFVFPLEFDSGAPETSQVVSTSPGTTTGGSQGSPTHFTYTTASALSIWLIVHGLGYVPSVFLTDSTGQQIMGDLFVVDLNTIRVEFSSATGGSAYLT